MKVTVKRKDMSQEVAIVTEFIKLESAMKLCCAASTGGSAKAVIQDGLVTVNGEICTMRGKKLYDGDIFGFEGQFYKIVKNESLSH